MYVCLSILRRSKCRSSCVVHGSPMKGVEGVGPFGMRLALPTSAQPHVPDAEKHASKQARFLCCLRNPRSCASASRTLPHLVWSTRGVPMRSKRQWLQTSSRCRNFVSNVLVLTSRHPYVSYALCCFFMHFACLGRCLGSHSGCSRAADVAFHQHQRFSRAALFGRS